MTVILTAAASVCMLIFELLKLVCCRNKTTLYNPFFIIGSVLLAISWIRILRGSIILGAGCAVRIAAGIILLIMSAVFYLYILFFALPHNTYGNARSDNELIDSGIYGRCRHPGFYGFIFVAVSLALIAGSCPGWISAAIYSTLNLGYIYLQDRYFFPKYLPGYDEYKQRVPFLAFWKKR